MLSLKRLLLLKVCVLDCTFSYDLGGGGAPAPMDDDALLQARLDNLRRD
jgi:hypothetical protein